MAWIHNKLLSHSPKYSTNAVTWTMFSATQQKKCGRFQNLHDINYQRVRLTNSVLLTNVKTLDLTMDIFSWDVVLLVKNCAFDQ
jgi:hypothetical protein